MRAPEEFADADADFVAGDDGGEHLAPGASHRLRDRQRRREHDRAGMEHRPVVDIVLLGVVRGRGVHQRGKERRGRSSGDQDFGGARRRPHLPRETLDAFHGPRALARERRGEPIE